MFSAVARLARGPVELTVGMAFERRFRLFAVDRRGLVFDTRFAPPVAGSTSAVIVYLLLEGELRWDSGQTLVGPALFLMGERDFEGESGKRGSTFRSWGTPFRTVELRIAPAECRFDVGASSPVVPLALAGADDPLVAAARVYLHASHAKKGQSVVAGLAAAYLTELGKRGVLATDLAATITHDEGMRGVIWAALRPIIESFGAGAKQDDVVTRVGWGARRVQRELTRMAIEHGVGWLGGWRDVAVRYRVRVAVMLLSNPSLSVTEVAEAVGYASAEALAHAFDACGLPSASELRRALLAEAAPSAT
jgi:AraC-like DNA-binding protein